MSPERERPVRPTSEKIASGKELRQRLPRGELARLSDWDRNPLGIINQQNETRVQELIPLRAERMSQSPYAFFRGTAAIMAADLAADENSSIVVGACGDAHLANFGFYASPQRTLVFDLNDFDEAAFAPWEWDLKRLVTSVVIAGQATARSPEVIERAALATVAAYGMAIRAASKMDPLARFFTMFDAESSGVSNKKSNAVLKSAIEAARKRTGDRAIRRLTEMDSDGRLRFVDDPPVMVHVTNKQDWLAEANVQHYLRSAGSSVYQLSRHYEVTDIARRVVGVGSVGTRCSLILLQDGDDNALVFQSKEANRSVLEEFGGIQQPPDLSDFVQEFGEGARIVNLQKLLQAVSDPFLGHMQVGNQDVYIRQFHDMKGGIEAETLEDGPFELYAKACAIVLARAHSQSVNLATIAGYIGGGKALGTALYSWAMAYAERSKSDYVQFLKSVSDHPES